MKSSRNQNPFTKAWWWRFAQIDTNPYESATHGRNPFPVSTFTHLPPNFFILLARKRLIVCVPGSMPPPQLELELCFFNLFRFFAKLVRPNIYASQTAKAPTKRAKKGKRPKLRRQDCSPHPPRHAEHNFSPENLWRCIQVQKFHYHNIQSP